MSLREEVSVIVAIELLRHALSLVANLDVVDALGCDFPGVLSESVGEPIAVVQLPHGTEPSLVTIQPAIELNGPQLILVVFRSAQQETGRTFGVGGLQNIQGFQRRREYHCVQTFGVLHWLSVRFEGVSTRWFW